MEKPKVKSIKRKKRRKNSTWQKILLKDLQLTDLQLFQQALEVNIANAAFDLEKRRLPKTREYIQ
jgi:hypothetical protein